MGKAANIPRKPHAVKGRLVNLLNTDQIGAFGWALPQKPNPDPEVVEQTCRNSGR